MGDFNRNTRLSRDEMTALQTLRLIQQTAYAYENSPFTTFQYLCSGLYALTL